MKFTLRMLLAAGLAFSLGRGLRWPNDWAEAHWLIGYRFGLLKRGLPGTLLDPFASPESALWAIRIVSAVMLAALAVTLWWMGSRLGNRGPAGALAALVFLTSPFAVYLAHLNGYYDVPVLLLSWGAVHLAGNKKYWAAGLLLAVAVFVHETVLILGLTPALLAVAVGSGGMNLQAMRRGAIVAAPPLAALGVIVVGQALTVDVFPARKAMIVHLAHYPFVQEFRHVIVPEAFTTSFLAYWHKESASFGGRMVHPFALQVLAPLAALLWWGLTRSGLRDKTTGVFLVAACLLPLSLHAVAWDTERIWTYPLVVAFFSLYALHRGTDLEAPERHTSTAALVALALLAEAQMILSVPLMDHAVDNLPLWERVTAAVLLFWATLGAGGLWTRLRQPLDPHRTS